MSSVATRTTALMREIQLAIFMRVRSAFLGTEGIDCSTDPLQRSSLVCRGEKLTRWILLVKYFFHSGEKRELHSCAVTRGNGQAKHGAGLRNARVWSGPGAGVWGYLFL